MNYGLVDIGSNTIRCNVYHILENKEFELLFSKKYTAGLAAYVESGSLSKKGISKLLRILKGIRLMTDQVDLEKLYVFATASLRGINNSEEVLMEVKEETGIEIELISQEEEAILGFLGIQHATSVEKGVSCDIGGGSTEIVLFDRGLEEKILKLDQGSLSLYRRFVDKILPSKKEIHKMKSFIRDKLSKYDSTPKFNTLVGIGGSVRAARNVIMEIYGTKKGEPFSVNMAKDLLDRIEEKNRETISMLLKVSPDRIHTFTPGLIILLELCRHFKVKEVKVCDNSIREGYLIKRLGEL